MARTKPFRFGIGCNALPSGRDWADLARQCEDLGYSALTMADHFDEHFAIGPALAHAAAVTTDLHVGTLVYAVDYKHPVVLAKETATLDLLSEGRFEFGLGAGWTTADYERAGMQLDRPGLRIERMVECLEIVRGLWGPGPFSYQGEHYTITELDGGPKPVRQPGPPVLLGGGGPRMLRTAGRHADIVSVNLDLRGGVIDSSVGSNATATQTDQKFAWVREGAGDRYDDLEFNIRVFVTAVTDDRDGMAGAMASGFGLTAAEALESPAALVGTVDEIVDTLLERRERWGFSYITVGSEVVEDFAPVVARLAGS